MRAGRGARSRRERATAASTPYASGVKPRVGVSACLLGDAVRYDGGHKRSASLVEVLAPHVELVRVCPEVELGMRVPREPIRLEGGAGPVRLVGVTSRQDWTDAMRDFAIARVGALAQLGLGLDSVGQLHQGARIEQVQRRRVAGKRVFLPTRGSEPTVASMRLHASSEKSAPELRVLTCVTLLDVRDPGRVESRNRRAGIAHRALERLL